MSDTLQDAWNSRLDWLRQGEKLFKECEELKKQILSVTDKCRIASWYVAVSSFYEAEFKKHDSFSRFMTADQVWHDAVVKEKGNIRVEWTTMKRSGRSDVYRCTLETGEVFEP